MKTISRILIIAGITAGLNIPNAEAQKSLLKQFEAEYAALCAEIPGGKQYASLEVLTVASLVEEEARSDEERNNIESR